MNTLFLLMAEFESIHVPAETVASKYLGLGKRETMHRASIGTLPFTTFRCGGSQKAPLMVDLRDVAAWIDQARKEGKRDFENINGIKPDI